MLTGYERDAYRDLHKIARALERLATAAETLVLRMDLDPLPPEPPSTAYPGVHAGCDIDYPHLHASSQPGPTPDD